MNTPVVYAAFAAWLPLTLTAFKFLGPRRAVPLVILAGMLLLPRDLYPWIDLGPFRVNKRTVVGSSLLLALLIFNPRALVRGRPRWPDLAMVAFVFAPIASLAANRFEESRASIAQTIRDALEWGVPYLMGRLYFGDRDGPRRIAVAVALAGLATVPLFLFEIVVGPRGYLAWLVYGMKPPEEMYERLGGWRPEGFFTQGIEAATWMALATTISTWVWLRRAWKPLPLPAWLPPGIQVLTVAACRGVYGYINLGVGLPAALILHTTRSRLILIALACVPPAYVVARTTGAWDGSQLAAMAGRMGKRGTVAYRLGAENSYIEKVAGHGLGFGMGGHNTAIFDWFSQRYLMPDGWWVNQLTSGGIFGLAILDLALFLLPAGLAIALPMDRRGGDSPGAMARGLALFLLLHQLDGLHNMAFLPPTPLIGGSLVGLFLARRSSRVDVPSHVPEVGQDRISPWVRVAIVVGALALLEYLGRLPR